MSDAMPLIEEASQPASTWSVSLSMPAPYNCLVMERQRRSYRWLAHSGRCVVGLFTLIRLKSFNCETGSQARPRTQQ